ncbi:MAG TPA: hypothetical protein VE666_00295 [Mycobacterium sp.]|jgi:hypothetical protein|nr:hypothetical protein [Mycobacterium sp.]
MAGIYRNLAIIFAAGLAPLAGAALMSAGVGNAAECGPGTFFDPLSNACLVAAPPPPPPPPPPTWNGDLTPGFGVGVCVPIPVPFAPSVCAGI